MITEWFSDFLDEHLRRHPNACLPDPETEDGVVLYAAWRKNFAKRGVNDLDVATEASELLVGEKLKGPRDHFPKLVALAVAVYKFRGAPRAEGRPADHESARLASADCGYCGGTGHAVVFHPDPSAARRIPPSCAAHCVCPMGRLIRTLHATKSPDVYRRTPDLAEVLAGRTGWLLDPPDPPAWETADATRVRIFGPGWPERLAALNAITRTPASTPTADPAVVAADPILAAESRVATPAGASAPVPPENQT